MKDNYYLACTAYRHLIGLRSSTLSTVGIDARNTRQANADFGRLPVHRALLFFLGLCCVLWLTHTEARASSFVKADCNDFINERPARVSCGFFSLPLNHDTDSIDNRQSDGVSSLIDKPGAIANGTVMIPVMIARSTVGLNATREAAVLIPGGGGPGAGMGFGYSYEPGEFLQSYETLRQAGIDVIIADQRGAGFSTPRLTCHESLVAFESMLDIKRTFEEELRVYQTSIADCRERLRQQHIDVEHFDTRQSALDFLVIMRELDYPQWFTIATSYATTIAQAMQALQAKAFDRIVLDSPVPLHYQHPLTFERTKRAIIETINRCEGVSSCARRYPGLAQKLDSVLVSATTEPYLIKIRVYNEEGNASIKTVVADDSTLLSILGTAVYYNEHISELPRVITQLHSGLTQSLNGYTETYWYQATDDTYADGLNMTVHCKERQPLEDEYVATRSGFVDGLSSASRLLLKSQQTLCQIWGVAAEPAVIPQLRSDTRTLILAGALDPVISVEDINYTAGYFSNASVETMAGAGHSVWYQHECARQRVIDFLTQEPDVLNETSAADCDAVIPGFK